MQKRRAAFTVIELIFVIVAIGILAIAAIPRLSATRDDARMVRMAQNIVTSANEIAAYAVSKGHTEQTLSDMSGALSTMVSLGEATEQPYQAAMGWGGVDDCVVLKVDNVGSNTEILRIIFGPNSSSKCDRLRSVIDTGQFPMPLRGTIIVF